MSAFYLTLTPYLLALLAGLLLAAPFLFPILFPVTWFSLIPLFWLLRGTLTLRQAFFSGWFTGVVTNLVGFYWLSYTISVFGGYPHSLSGLIFFFFGLYSALPIAIFSLLVRRCGLGPFALFPPLFWVAIEFWFPLLFPWHLANSQADFLTLVQSADLVGPYGTSFLLVWVNAVLFKIAESYLSPQGERRILWREALVVGAAFVAVIVYGQLRLKALSTAMSNAPSLTLAAVQGNIDIRYKGKMAYLESNLQSYKDLTKKAQGSTLVVWPESALEAWLPEELTQLPAELLPAVPPGTPFLLFGARSFRKNPGSPISKAFNSAFLVNGQGRVLSRYHKQVLLAFGEYIPLSSVLSKLPGLPPIGDGFTPGDGPRTLDLSPGIKLAPLICYEDLMPWLSRRFVMEGRANLLINLTNDAWFGDTAAPWQHARLSQWRAIEVRRTLVRATNTGLTTVINPKGEILETLPTFSSGVLKAKVPLMGDQTLYVRFGDWFAWIATLASLSILAVHRRTRPFRKSQATDNLALGLEMVL